MLSWLVVLPKACLKSCFKIRIQISFVGSSQHFRTKVTMAGKHSAPKVKAKAKGKASAKDASAEPATKKARVTGKTPDANAKSMVDLNHPTRKFMEAAGFASIT